METATYISPTPDQSRDGEPGQGCPKPDISESNQPLQNVVPMRARTSYRCHRCGLHFDSLAPLQVHFMSCFRPLPLDSDDDKNEDENEDEDDDEDEDIEVIQDEHSESYDLQGRLYAEWAVKHLNKLDEGKKYELVEAGPYNATGISRGPIFHINFKAKERDCPEAEVETFFAQARMHPAFQIDVCVSLGPSHYLPRKPFIDGCAYCKRWPKVHHPVERCAKLIRNVEGEDVSWLYGDK